MFLAEIYLYINVQIRTEKSVLVNNVAAAGEKLMYGKPQASRLK